MPVTSVQFVRSSKYAVGVFRVSLLWMANVSTILLAACPRGEVLDEKNLLESVRSGVRPDALNAQVCPKGSDAYDFCPARLAGKWVDIHAFDLDSAGGVVRKDEPRTKFFGQCVVGFQIKAAQRVSTGLKSVRIALENQSAFAIPAYSLGYRVGSEMYGIPIELKRGERAELPQVEIPAEQNLELCQLPDALPVAFVPLTR